MFHAYPCFPSELNNIETHTGDISNTYLNSLTKEKIVFKSGPYFAPFGHAGQFLIIKTTLYGLKSYVASFHSFISDTLTDLGFVPSVGKYNIWI